MQDTMVRAFEHSGQSRSPVCKRTAQMIHIFTPALAIASTIALLQPLSSYALRSSAAFARALSRSPLACAFSDVPLSAESSLAKSAEQSAKAAPAKPTLATAAKAMVFGYLKFIAVSFGFIEVRSETAMNFRYPKTIALAAVASVGFAGAAFADCSGKCRRRRSGRV